MPVAKRLLAVVLIVTLNPYVFTQSLADQAQVEAIRAAINDLEDESSIGKLADGISSVTTALDRLEQSQPDRTTLQRAQELRTRVLYHETRLRILQTQRQVRRERTSNILFRLGGALIAGAGVGLATMFYTEAQSSYTDYQDASLTSDAETYRQDAQASMNMSAISGAAGIAVGSALFFVPPAILDLRGKIDRGKDRIRELEAELQVLEQTIAETE